jgi:hypothetical protein
MFDLHPGQDQKAAVVSEKAKVATPGLGAPADEPVAAAQGYPLTPRFRELLAEG